MPLMMENTNNSLTPLTNQAILELMGNFIKEYRINQNKTQQEVADDAGVNRSTLVQIENGSGGNMLSFIQLLRAINQLQLLEAFEITPQISPIALAELQQEKRQRASTKNQKPKPGKE